MEILLILGICFLAGFLTWLAELKKQAALYRANKPRLDRVDELERELTRKTDALEARHEAITLIAKQKAIGFPWLANAYAEFHSLEEERRAVRLEQKKHPAYKSAEEVRVAAKKRREAETEARILRYQIEYYEALFPWLAELKSEEIDDELIKIRSGKAAIEEDGDPAKRWLTAEEFSKLPDSRKFELALERYWTKRKNKWEIGRDYERYIGYKYEIKGYKVSYYGILEGFDDLGRDLICEKNGNIMIVQCKQWAQERQIHEKHIFQLFGTMISFRIRNKEKKVHAHFVTSTKLSPRAKEFADELAIKVSEGVKPERYPCIKCNISKRDGLKIYHLPFDQQYDRTTIIPNSGELYVSTVQEAEKHGFRRAFRHRGSNIN